LEKVSATPWTPGSESKEEKEEKEGDFWGELFEKSSPQTAFKNFSQADASLIKFLEEICQYKLL